MVYYSFNEAGYILFWNIYHLRKIRVAREFTGGGFASGTQNALLNVVSADNYGGLNGGGRWRVSVLLLHWIEKSEGWANLDGYQGKRYVK